MELAAKTGSVQTIGNGTGAMKKVYGKTQGRAMRWAGRTLLAVMIAVPVVASPMIARADSTDDMYLMGEQHPIVTNGWAWLSLGLSIVSFGVAYNDYNETEYNVKKAKQAYSNYLSASDPNVVEFYRNQTTTYSDRAQAYESTTNASLFLGTVLAITAIAIWHSDKTTEDVPLLLSDRGITYRIHF
jgi:hypothetical protein